MANPRLKLTLPLEINDVDMRDAFFNELNRLATEDRNTLLLTDDQGAFSLDWMRQNLPNQYFNVGIAEQNLVSVAAGLALGGKVPFIYGIANFMSMRCYEQIRDDLCALGLPVTIVGSGPGYTYASDGPTHHATHDVAIMRTLPGMTILSPSDAASTSHFAQMAYRQPEPTYVRIEKGTLGKIYEDGHDFSAGFDVLIEGTDLIIVSTGYMVQQAVTLVEELRHQGISAGLLDLYRLKPVDGSSLLKAIGAAPRIATLEEHSLIGGLGSIISEILADEGEPTPIKRFALPDRFTYKYGSRDWLLAQDGLDTHSVATTILRWITEAP